LLGTDLLTAGRYQEARAVLDLNRLTPQTDPVGCRAALALVRVLVREGEVAEADRLLQSLHDAAIRLGHEGRWHSTRQEVEAARFWPPEVRRQASS
jgi:hypothetical protein